MKTADLKGLNVEVITLTVLVSSAVARYFAPSVPILFNWRFSVVSVCIEWREQFCKDWMWQLSLSPYWFAVHLLDTSLLQHRYSFPKSPVLWVSLLNENSWFKELEGKAITLTLLVCSAVDKYFAPSVPISLSSRLNVVSVYIEWRRQIYKVWMWSYHTHHIGLQCSCEILRSFSTDVIFLKMQCC